MNMYTENEKKLLKLLVEKELTNVQNENSTIVHKQADFVAAEKKYEDVLKELVEKLK